jgi:hypothetical protein
MHDHPHEPHSREGVARVLRASPSGPPRVSSEGSGHISFPDVAAAYGRLLEAQARVRTVVAAVATPRKRLQVQIDQLAGRAGQNSRPPGTGDDRTAGEGTQSPEGTAQRLADLRRQHAAMQAEERRVTAAAQRLQDTSPHSGPLAWRLRPLT